MRNTNDGIHNPNNKLAVTANEIISNFAKDSVDVRIARDFLKEMTGNALSYEKDDFRRELFKVFYHDFDRLLHSIEIFKMSYIDK